MSGYFKVRPKFRGCFSSSSPGVTCFQSGPVRHYVPLSERMRAQTVTGSAPDIGTLIDPQFSSGEVLAAGHPNPFTDPRMSGLDRFEYAQASGLDYQTSLDAAAEADRSLSDATPSGVEPASPASEPPADV